MGGQTGPFEPTTEVNFKYIWEFGTQSVTCAVVLHIHVKDIIFFLKLLRHFGVDYSINGV